MYKVILADPPWQFNNWSEKGEGRNPNQHYDLLDTIEIKKFRIFIDKLSADDCVLLLWATYPRLPDALEVMKSWGFEYKTVAFTWIKKNRTKDTFWMGLGYWTRANAEICLLGTRGKPKRLESNVRQLIISKRREHSRKPDQQYKRIERLLEGPYIELFARPPHPKGWDVWGNEIDNHQLRLESLITSENEKSTKFENHI